MPIQYRNSYPYWYYKNVALADRGVSLGNQYLIWTLKSGFNYWIRGLLISYPHYTHVANPDDVSPPLYLALCQTERNRTITEIPIPVDLMANPGSIQPPPPGHAQEERRDLVNGFIRFDYLLSSSDVLNIKISGHVNGFPEYVRLCVMGNNIKV